MRRTRPAAAVYYGSTTTNFSAVLTFSKHPQVNRQYLPFLLRLSWCKNHSGRLYIENLSIRGQGIKTNLFKTLFSTELLIVFIFIYSFLYNCLLWFGAPCWDYIIWLMVLFSGFSYAANPFWQMPGIAWKQRWSWWLPGGIFGSLDKHVRSGTFWGIWG